MKIRFTKSLISNPSYKKGQEVELNDKEAKQFVKVGYAIEVKAPKTNRKKSLRNVESR
jgi:hypothetical protein